MRLTLQTAKRFQDLLGSDEPEGPYAFKTIFDSSTWRSRRLSGKKFTMLRRIDEAVRSLLEKGETVHFVSTGSPVSFWESYFLGWFIYYLNRRALILTDRRIILIQINSRSRPKELRSQLRYTAIVEVRKSWVNGTNVLLRSGKSRAFSGVPKADRRFLVDLVARLKTTVGEGFAARGVEELCPHCYVVATKGSAQCTSCGGPFKSAKRAGLLSLLLPGLGDFYIGHRKIAAFEIFIVLLIWLGALWPDPEYSFNALGYAIVAAFVVLFFHVPDAIGTWYIAKMGIYPAGHRGSA